MLPESGEVLCAAGPLVFGSPNETLMGHVAAGHCWSSHGWDVGARGYYCCCSAPQRYLSSSQNLFMLPDPCARLPPEQKLEIMGVGSQRGCGSELRASHGRTQPWWVQSRGLWAGERLLSLQWEQGWKRLAVFHPCREKALRSHRPAGS